MLERSIVWFRTAALLALAVFLGRYLYVRTMASLHPNDADAEPHGPWPGLRQPAVQSGDDVALSDNAEVIGVVVSGKARAYAIYAFGLSPAKHVVNDLIGEEPVSITYCDRTNCARVFTSAAKGVPLNLDVAGFTADGMALLLDGVEYDQTTGKNLTAPDGAPLPYRACPFERTTWGSWRRAHPDSEVFAGG